MLVLTRSVNQTIHIGDDIVITIVQLDNNKQVRVGITAPKEVPVHRGEVQQRIKNGRK